MQNATSIKHFRLKLISVQSGCKIVNDASTKIIRIKLAYLTANGLVMQQNDVNSPMLLELNTTTFSNLLMWEINVVLYWITYQLLEPL